MAEYHAAWAESIDNPDAFWAHQAERFFWYKPFKNVCSFNFETPDIKWFGGGKTNICVNALDRHLPRLANQPALIYEPNDPSEIGLTLTYKELYERVCRIANALRELGVKKHDRVCIYLPMVPDLPAALLACARIGAIHSVVFAGFSASALADRINDSGCKVVLTADGAFRGPKQMGVKSIVDEAVTSCPSVEKVVVLQHTGTPVGMVYGRDIWWHELVNRQDAVCAPEQMDAEDMLFILYTSGSTGKPKGVVHSTAGYMVWADYTFRNVFQIEDQDVFFCTADVGWITGHTYLTYGPLLAGSTTLMFEGVPTWPDAGRFWEIIDKHQVNVFYTAPTAIRSLMAAGVDIPLNYKLDSLRVLGSVGEPINEEAWLWYHEKVGRGHCPIVDTWWQTETGGIMIAPLAGITPTKPAYATLPLPGVEPVLLDSEGNELVGNGVEGNLCLRRPNPSMVRTTYGDHERCRTAYFATYKGYYFTGDGCKRDEDGYYRILGRVDDVINVSGHRIGTAEVEDAICQHFMINEAAVVGMPHEIKGQGIYAFVIKDQAANLEDAALRKEILDMVTKVIGPIAKPDFIQFVPGLPKTRSGKIMRRILRKIVEQDLSNLGDTTTLLDPSIVVKLVDGHKQLAG